MNNIVNHFIATGIDPHAERLASQRFGYASSQTFEEALRNTAEIQSAFEEQPAKVRSAFANNAGAWLDAITTPHTTPDANASPEAPQELSEPPVAESKPAPENAPISGQMDST